MKKILVLGAGFVAGPLVRYFLEQPDVEVAVADLEPGKAAALIGVHPRGRAFGLDLKNESALPSDGGPVLSGSAESHGHNFLCRRGHALARCRRPGGRDRSPE
jgi:hypothetical protein